MKYLNDKGPPIPRHSVIQIFFFAATNLSDVQLAEVHRGADDGREPVDLGLDRVLPVLAERRRVVVLKSVSISNITKDNVTNTTAHATKLLN